MNIKKCKVEKNREWSVATKTGLAAVLGISAFVSLSACDADGVSATGIDDPRITSKDPERTSGDVADPEYPPSSERQSSSSSVKLDSLEITSGEIALSSATSSSSLMPKSSSSFVTAGIVHQSSNSYKPASSSSVTPSSSSMPPDIITSGILPMSSQEEVKSSSSEPPSSSSMPPDIITSGILPMSSQEEVKSSSSTKIPASSSSKEPEPLGGDVWDPDL